MGVQGGGGQGVRESRCSWLHLPARTLTWLLTCLWSMIAPCIHREPLARPHSFHARSLRTAVHPLHTLRTAVQPLHTLHMLLLLECLLCVAASYVGMSFCVCGCFLCWNAFVCVWLLLVLGCLSVCGRRCTAVGGMGHGRYAPPRVDRVAMDRSELAATLLPDCSHASPDGTPAGGASGGGRHTTIVLTGENFGARPDTNVTVGGVECVVRRGATTHTTIVCDTPLCFGEWSVCVGVGVDVHASMCVGERECQGVRGAPGLCWRQAVCPPPSSISPSTHPTLHVPRRVCPTLTAVCVPLGTRRALLRLHRRCGGRRGRRPLPHRVL